MFLKELLQGKRRFLMDILLQWLRGYVRIEITGTGTSRFFQICQHRQLPLWEKSVGAQKGSCCLSVDDVPALAPVLRKTHVKFHILEKNGAPFFLCRYKKRKLFAAGIVLCLLFLRFLSGFLWDIQIYGSDLYSPAQVQAFLERKGLSLGYPCKKINCEKLEEQLREHFKDIAWVSCEQKGTQFIVHMKDTIDVRDVNTSKSPCDLVASRDGTIYSIVTRSGTPLVKKGDKVKKGDVLISGIVHILDDFDAELETDFTNADGDILAETTSIYKDSFSLDYYAKTETGRKQHQFFIRLGVWNLPLIPNRDKFSNSYSISDYHRVRLGRTFFLPLGWEWKTVHETTLDQKTRSRSDAKALAKKRFNQYCRKQKRKGIRILETMFRDGSCVTIGTIHSVESIGKIHAIKKEKKKTPDDRPKNS